ncbi:MAG: hypothetical protein QOE41_2118 [Mycobacterium sp.]|jgi:hypothetical protein|nr:Uncharacterized protein [Mycobacterium sp.]MDT5132807.1 hypothetical protein [Mycobacterium sp.]
MRTAPTRLPCYIIEWYRPELTDDALDVALARLDTTVLTLSAQGVPIHILMTLAVPTDEVIYCVFAADSSASVIRACQAAGIPAGRITTGLLAATGCNQRRT